MLDGDEGLHHRAAVHQAHPAAGEHHFALPGQLAQDAQTLLAQLIPVVGIVGKGLLPHAIVPVAADDQIAAGHGPVEGFIVAGALAHGIPQTDDPVRLLLLQVSFQRAGGGPVAVQVSHEGDLHRDSSFPGKICAAKAAEVCRDPAGMFPAFRSARCRSGIPLLPSQAVEGRFQTSCGYSSFATSSAHSSIYRAQGRLR